MGPTPDAAAAAAATAAAAAAAAATASAGVWMSMVPSVCGAGVEGGGAEALFASTMPPAPAPSVTSLNKPAAAVPTAAATVADKFCD